MTLKVVDRRRPQLIAVSLQVTAWTRLSLRQFKRCLKTFLFGSWDYGALWLFVKQRRIEIVLLTYLLTYQAHITFAAVTALSPVPPYTAWWQRHIGVGTLPRVFTPWNQPRLKPNYLMQLTQLWCSIDALKCHKFKQFINMNKCKKLTFYFILFISIRPHKGP